MRTANTNGGGQKHTQTTDEETKGGLRTENTDEGGQKHTHPRDEETKGGSEDSKQRRGRTKAHTN